MQAIDEYVLGFGDNIRTKCPECGDQRKKKNEKHYL